MDTLGAAITGVIAGILVVIGVEVLDLKRHVDDPAGAVGAHFANGSFGTLAVGLFSCRPDGPELFYGGGFMWKTLLRFAPTRKATQPCRMWSKGAFMTPGPFPLRCGPGFSISFT